MATYIEQNQKAEMGFGHNGHEGKYSLLLEQRATRYPEQSIIDFCDEFESDGPDGVPINAADLTYRAITSLEPIISKFGPNEYPAFTQRDDEFAVKGINLAIEDLVHAIKESSQSGEKDEMLMLVGPSGSGKSTITWALERMLEDYTKDHPIPYVEGCHIREDPRRIAFSVADERTRKNLAESQPGLHDTQCPCCQESLENGNMRNAKVKKKPVAANRSQFIATIDPQHSYSSNGDTIAGEILNSNRGVLFLPEFTQQNPVLYTMLHDIVRGRRVQLGRRRYELDNLIIGSSPLNEWESFSRQDQFRSLLNRIRVVEVNYNLSRDNESDIYRKILQGGKVNYFENMIDNEPEQQSVHISAQTLDALSGIAVASRMVESNFKEAAIDDKLKGLSIQDRMRVYDGKLVEGIPASERAKLMREGRKQKEGMYGLSPDDMVGVLLRSVAEVKGNCITPLDIYTQIGKTIEDRIGSGKLSDESAKQIREQVHREQAAYETKLRFMVLSSFDERFDVVCNGMFDQYLDEVELKLSNLTRFDPVTEQDVAADEDFLKEIEDLGHPGMKLDERKRDRLRNEALRIIREAQKDGRRVEVADIDWLRQGIGEAIFKRGGYEQLLQSDMGVPKTQEQKDRWREASHRLIENHGFCNCCAKDMMKHVSQELESIKK